MVRPWTRSGRSGRWYYLGTLSVTRPQRYYALLVNDETVADEERRKRRLNEGDIIIIFQPLKGGWRNDGAWKTVSIRPAAPYIYASIVLTAARVMDNPHG